MLRSKNMNVSFCLPVYNEEYQITRTLPLVIKTLPKLGVKKFEIIVVDNGSTDKTASKMTQFSKDKRVRFIRVKEKGLGIALKKAILEASYENIFFTGVDLPFGFSDLSQIIKIEKDFDIIFGSKRHPSSVTDRPISRTLSSYLYSQFLKRILNSYISDPQGSIFMKKSKMLGILSNLDSKGFFFTTQIAIYGQLNNLKMKEIPVKMENESRPSTVNIFSDGASVLISLLAESVKIQRQKLSLNRDVTNSITSFLDEFVPPFLRDSKFIMSPIFKILFKEQAELFMTFKNKATNMKKSEFSRIYKEVNKVAVSRKTDLNEACIKKIQKEIKGKTILEVGCGRVYLSNLLSDNYKVTASDIAIDKELIFKYPRLTFVEADAEKLPFKAMAFDTVVCTHTLEHVLNFEKAVSELRRVARKRIIIVVPKQRPYKYTFDLHINFFPYKETLLLALNSNPKTSKCVELDHDFLYLEEIT